MIRISNIYQTRKFKQEPTVQRIQKNNKTGGYLSCRPTLLITCIKLNVTVQVKVYAIFR